MGNVSRNKSHFVTKTCFVLWILFKCVGSHCSRSHSRTVRNLVKENLHTIFEELNARVPIDCPFHESRDLYGVQEMNRYEEYSSRWRCELCGKAFYSSYHLDLHFDNRHSSQLVKETPVCLADYCDIFRCDILMERNTDRFWEQALCKEEQMVVVQRRCQSLVRSCLLRANVTAEQKMQMFEKIDGSICSFLTCVNYWKKPAEIAGWKIVLYAVFSPFFLMALVLYYFSVWEHYHGDGFTLNSTKDIEEDSHATRRNDAGVLRKRYGRTHMY